LPPILIILDEFPRLGTCHAIKNGLATLRSRGVTFALFVQNLSQLDERYGIDGRKDILGCCTYKVLLNVTEPDDQRYFSDLIGTDRVAQRGIGASYDAASQILRYNASVSEMRERRIEPEELGFLGGELILIATWGSCRLYKASFYNSNFRNLLVPPRNFSIPTFSYQP